jgi:activator of 2-hydroxyglutaryl-CoA dehydratase
MSIISCGEFSPIYIRGTIEMNERNNRPMLFAGIDIGSTTTKIVAIEEDHKTVSYSDYQRHHADQLGSVKRILEQLAQKYPDSRICLAFTGSGAKPVSEMAGLPFVQ